MLTIQEYLSSLRVLVGIVLLDLYALHNVCRLLLVFFVFVFCFLFLSYFSYGYSLYFIDLWVFIKPLIYPKRSHSCIIS